MAFAQVCAIHGFIDRLPVRYLLVRFGAFLVPRKASSSLCPFRHDFHDSVRDCGFLVSQENRVAPELAHQNVRCLSHFFLLSFVVVRTTSVTNSSCMYTAGVYD